MAGLTFDAGALVALERRDRRMWAVFARARETGVRPTVPAAVIVEWWRGQRGAPARLLDSVDIEPLSDRIARIAGEALGQVGGGGPSATDAVVMASAAQRGDIVYTSDFTDLARFASVFPGVRLLAV